MWCDDFDMDLPKVLPEYIDVLGDFADVVLYTHGHQEDGKLNHPSVWNGDQTMLAFFSFTPVGFKSNMHYTPDPVVRCTFNEVIRDCWPHNYAIILNVFCGASVGWRSIKVWDTFQPELQEPFFDIMYHLRGIRRLPTRKIDDHKVFVLRTLIEATHWLRIGIEMSRIPVEGVRYGNTETR